MNMTGIFTGVFIVVAATILVVGTGFALRGIARLLSGNSPSTQRTPTSRSPLRVGDLLEERARKDFPDASPAAANHEMMNRQVRSWGLSLLALGAVHLVAGGLLNGPWGIVLIVVGALSFLFRDAAMFVLYAVTTVWAAINNFLIGQVVWIGFGIIQMLFVFQLFQTWRYFHTKQAECKEEGPPQGTQTTSSRAWQASQVFPWAALLIGGIALAMFVGSFAIAIFVVNYSSDSTFAALDTAVTVAVHLAVLGAGFSLASVLSRFESMTSSILGGIFASITLVLYFLLVFFSRAS